MTKKALDEKYSYQINEHNVVHLFRGEEDCQQLLTNPLLSAIFKIETLEKENAELKEVHESDKRSLRLIAKKGADFEKAYNEAEELLDKQIEATYKLFEENKELKEEIAELEKEVDEAKLKSGYST